MSRNIMTITKWVPLQTKEIKNLFLECNQLEISTKDLIQLSNGFINEFQLRDGWKSYQMISEKALLLDKLKIICDIGQQLIQSYNEAYIQLNIIRSALIQIKVQLWKRKLWELKLKLCYFLQQVIMETAFLFVYLGKDMLVLTFRLSNAYNQYIGMDLKHRLASSSTICSNTCPYLMYPLRRISITRLLQILAQNRSEICSHHLIDCLLETYRLYETHDDDISSDNSSIEIYRAITKHMSSPGTIANRYQPKKDDGTDVKESYSFASMDELITYEEQNVLDLLEVVIKIAPSMLGSDGIKKSKTTGEIKINNKAKAKVLDYYQQILWGEVGNFLEHIILWWGTLPLATRSPHSSQHLREWITQFLPTIEIPAVIYSTLISLADALGMHVTSTSWDQSFRLVLVASKAPYNQDNGRLFCDMLQNLVMLCNQCESTSDWIVGAPIEELPLVEQIPVLHRLDHSIHTTRLWAINECKRLANNWNADNFFLITHCDMVNCLTQLNELRLADHSLQIEKEGLTAHVKVCGSMRAKLVSEVKTNHQLLKDATKKCIDVLASVCRMVSLANLQMIFPDANYYKKNSFEVTNSKSSEYVDKYLDEILSPVLAATDDHHISNMILRIMCESWLDHIYMNKVRFSHQGAYQLLTDFESVNTWLINCPIVTQQMRKKMVKNEVLRRCQGVGRLLLRSPGEHLKMNEKNKLSADQSPRSDNTEELMPPEMYVPNQEQWLELRANKKRTCFTCSLCCSNVNY